MGTIITSYRQDKKDFSLIIVRLGHNPDLYHCAFIYLDLPCIMRIRSTLPKSRLEHKQLTFQKNINLKTTKIMKKYLWILFAFILIVSNSCKEQIEDDKISLEENKGISTLYHERNLDDIDKVLADNFIGSFYFTEPEAITWDEESHRSSITNSPDFEDSILFQIAEGEWVATRFIRTGTYEGSLIKTEGMQFKQFENGKIIRSWEVFSPNQQINETGPEGSEQAPDTEEKE